MVESHRIVSGGVFVQSQIDAYQKEGGKAEQITEEQYRKERK